MSLLEMDLSALLAINGIGVVGVNIFRSVLSEEGSNQVVVRDESGMPSIEGPVSDRRVLFLVRNLNFDTGAAIVENIKEIVHDKVDLLAVLSGPQKKVAYSRAIDASHYRGLDNQRRHVLIITCSMIVK